MGLVNHWAPERHPEWANQQAAFVLGFIIDNQAILSKVNEVQRVLDLKYLDRVEAGSLHIAVADLGNADVTSRDQASALAREVVKAQRQPLAIELGVAAVFGESVLSFVDPVEEIEAMQEQAVLAVSRFNRVALRVPTFPPHLTLAWSNNEGPSSDLAGTLAEFPVDGLGGMTLTELCLLRVRREGRQYFYDVVDRFPLEAGKSAGSGKGDDAEGRKPIWKRLFK